MFEFLVGLGVGIVVAIITGLLVWRNNKGKWGAILSEILVYVDKYDDINKLKDALYSLLSPLRK